MMKKIFALILITVMLLCSNAFASVMIVTGTPTYGDSEGMTQNLTRAIEALNGQKIEKGKSFSLNKVLGPRTEANGFAIAPNGNGCEVMGGGVSQVATTLYLALKELGENVSFDERYTFGSMYNAGYVDAASDTALTDYARGLDFRFTNKSSTDLVISMWESGGTLFCQLLDADIVPDSSGEDTSKADSNQTYYIVNVRQSASLREKPSTNAKVLAEVPRDSAVLSEGDTTDGFMRVEYNGKTGYIHARYLSKVAPADVWLTVVNCNTSVSLRETASKKATRLADVTLGEKVRSLDHEDNGFLEVEYGELRGFILKEYLEEARQE